MDKFSIKSLGKLVELSGVVNLAAFRTIRNAIALEKRFLHEFGYFRIEKSEFFLLFIFTQVLHTILPQIKNKLNTLICQSRYTDITSL
jgi:hypothetical protein